MPETLIPIVAIIGASEGSEGVAVGAIIGAPFLLATLAMALVGFSAYLFRGAARAGTRPQGRHSDARSRPDLLPRLLRRRAAGRRRGPRRACTSRWRSSSRAPISSTSGARSPAAAQVQEAETIGRLYMDRGDDDEPSNKLIGLQLAVGLGAIVGGAHLFVEEMIHVAESIGVEPLVLSLILAPLATELPEKINSFFWVREGKDSLALGNITGAMVFQSTIPVAVRPGLHRLGPRSLRGRLRLPRSRRRRARLLHPADARAVHARARDRLGGPVRVVPRLRARQQLAELHRLAVVATVRGADGARADQARVRPGRRARGRRASSAGPSGRPSRSCRRGRSGRCSAERPCTSCRTCSSRPRRRTPRRRRGRRRPGA